MKKAIYKILNTIRNKLGSRITVQLLIIFFLCAFVSFTFFHVSMYFERKAMAEYDRISESMVIDGYNLVLAMQNENLTSDDTDKIKSLIDSHIDKKAYRIMLTDLEGNALYSSSGEQTDKPPLTITIQGNTTDNTTIAVDMGLYAVKLNDKILQLSLVSAENAGWIARYVKNGVIPGIAALLSIMIFITLFFLLTGNKISYIREIASGVKVISQGNFDFRVRVKGNNELSSLAKELNYMTGELFTYFEREKKQERSKAEFMLSVSHDLKSPLTAIICYLSLLKDKEYESDAAMADYVERAYHKSLRLQGLLQELLDYAGLSGEDIRLSKQTISLRHMIEQLISEYSSVLKQSAIQMKTDLTDEDAYAEVDPNYIIRVFENLLSNAIRYSPKPGEIHISLDHRDNGLLFSITNDCEEIDNEELKHIFDKFYRLDKSRSEKTGGTGLGLAIAQRITQLHDGKIWAEYKNGKIAFLVLLPERSETQAYT